MTTKEIFQHDLEYLPRIVGGCDEAGRGPLAGPVVCACCIMPSDKMIDQINDSKQLNETKREKLYELIVADAIDYGVAIIDHETIDAINILNATKLGMKQAVANMETKPDLLLVDAVKKLDISVEYLSIIKGDMKSYNIAAASIIAKVTRDRIMREYDLVYPQYSFVSNKGYGTKAHINAIFNSGLCPIHRQTFVKNFTEQKDEEQA